MKKIAIIGGGASGMLAALNLVNKAEVTIFEKLNILGKKLSQTGNGRGNITNLNMNSKYYNHNIDNVLNIVSPNYLIDFFKGLGVLTRSDLEGRVYPLTSAKEFCDLIYKLIKDKAIIKHEEVSEIKDSCVIYNNKSEKFDFIILANGSSASIKDYRRIKTNLKYKEFKSCLTPIYFKNKALGELFGLRIKSKASLFLDDSLAHEELGELQFRRDSISGIMIFQISSIISRSNYKNKYIILDFLPNIDNIEEIIKEIKNKSLFEYTIDALEGILPRILVKLFIDEYGINRYLKNINVKALANLIKSFKIEISNNLSNEFAQVCNGGILLDEVSLETFESRIKNLYVIGEALDIDGLCGGYNLHFAFSSAIIASKAIGEKC